MKKLTSIILATVLALSTVGYSFALNGFSKAKYNETTDKYEIPIAEAQEYVRNQMLSSKIKESDIKVLDLTTEENVEEFLKANPKSEVKQVQYGTGVARQVLLIDKETFNKYNVFNFKGTILWYPLKDRKSIEKDHNVKLTGTKGYALPYEGYKALSETTMGGFSVWKQSNNEPFYVPEQFQPANNGGDIGIKTQVFIPDNGYVRVQKSRLGLDDEIITYFGIK